jgi:hypothetical protein
MNSFLVIYAKGGESMSPKQKDRTTTEHEPKAKGPHHHQFQNLSLSIWF